MKIVMHDSEVDLLKTFLSRTSNYFEFGMGGSTCLAATLVKQRISAVDSDASWVASVRETIGETDKYIDLRHVDIGRTGSWGAPVSRERETLFARYSQSILETGFRDFDLCLVDGRFRVACFLQALQFLRADAIIAIHDYAVRPHYHVVEEFARPIATAHQLSFFIRRPDVNWAALSLSLESHRLKWE